MTSKKKRTKEELLETAEEFLKMMHPSRIFPEKEEEERKMENQGME